MSGIISKLSNVSEDMNQLGMPWALVGALAVSIYCEPRTTRDIDLALALPHKTDQENLIQELFRRGYKDARVLMHVMPTHQMGLRLQIRGDSELPVALDLLFASSGIESEIVTSAQKIELLPQLFVPVAKRAHLIAMKVLSQNDSDRLRDIADLQQLLTGACEDDLTEAEKAINLMTQRGFNRTKNLQAEFSAAIQRYAPKLIKT